MQTRVKWPYFEVYGHYTSQNLLTLAYLTFFRCVLKFLMCVQLTKNLAKNVARIRKKRVACILQTKVKWPYFEVSGHYTTQNLLTLAYLTVLDVFVRFLMCVQLTKNLAENLARNLARKWQKTSAEKMTKIMVGESA